MKLKVNGKDMEFDSGIEDATVAHLLNHLKIKTKVVVEKNGVILDDQSYSADELSEGDIIEIVQFVGGG